MIGIEEAFSFNLPGVSVPVIDAIDVVEEDEPDTVVISNFKTAGRAYSISEVRRLRSWAKASRSGG